VRAATAPAYSGDEIEPVDDLLPHVRQVLVEQRIVEVAGRQHGLITTEQLISCGMSTSAISRARAASRLHRVYRGVYAVGHTALSLPAKWKAATLSCGQSAVLSHRSAAELWRMLEVVVGLIHVAVITPGGRARRDGLQIHRLPSLQSRDITLRHGIPVTTPQRTLLDLRGAIEPGELRRAIRQAEILDLPIDARAIISDRATSELELRFLALCRRHRLPPPETNVLIGGLRVDFVWREARLVVETDGRKYHRGIVASEDDRARHERLEALGYDVLRFTWDDVVRRPAATAKLVRQRLRARSTRTSR
jgi:very-short-patch-repair endonuclease